jgi:hypothetical protein
MMLAVGLLLFPKLALGLSGFETGCRDAVVRGGRETEQYPRSNQEHEAAVTAALIASFPDLQQLCDDGSHSQKHSEERPMVVPWLFWHIGIWGSLWDDVRQFNQIDSLVCRGVGNGWIAQSRSAISSSLWNGPGVGKGPKTSGYDISRDHVWSHVVI